MSLLLTQGTQPDGVRVKVLPQYILDPLNSIHQKACDLNGSPVVMIGDADISFSDFCATVRYVGVMLKITPEFAQYFSEYLEELKSVE